jgi:hypothetical protein
VDCDGSVETTGGKTPSAHPFTPKVGLSWEPDENSMYYLSAGKGFRVGGVNNPSTATDRPGCPGGLQSPDTYDSDELWSYEIGAKNQFADGRIRTQAGVFYIDWKDIQQSVSANGCFTSSYKDNLGSAEVSGFDVSAEFLPMDGLSIAVSGGYTRARYSETAFGAPASGTGIRAIIAEDGDSLGVSPWNATLSGEYEFVAWGQPSYVRLDYSYTDNGFAAGLPPRGDNESSWPLMAPRLGDARIGPEPAQITWTRDAFVELLRIRSGTTMLRLRTAEEVQRRLRLLGNGPAGSGALVAAQHPHRFPLRHLRTILSAFSASRFPCATAITAACCCSTTSNRRSSSRTLSRVGSVLTPRTATAPRRTRERSQRDS